VEEGTVSGREKGAEVVGCGGKGGWGGEGGKTYFGAVVGRADWGALHVHDCGKLIALEWANWDDG